MNKLKSLVTNLELSRKLKEAGVKQDSLFYWNGSIISRDLMLKDKKDEVITKGYIYSAFTAGELGELLPNGYFTTRLGHGWSAFWTDNTPDYLDWKDKIVGEKTEADARAKMLLYLIKHKLITL